MPAFRISVPPGVERTALIGAVAASAAAAWALLWLGDANHGALHFHGQGTAAGPSVVAGLALFVVAWTGMSLAMMLPTSLPVLTVLHTFAGQRPDRFLLVGLAAAGYVAAWVGAGALVGPINLALQGALASPLFASAHGLIAPALLLIAGLFQFSALKYRCLEKCRSPLAVVLSHWTGRRQRWEAFRLGWASGIFCVGCCWALMLLMLLSSVPHLVLMLGLGAIMALEKNVRWGRRLSAPLGYTLIACSVLVFVTGGERFWEKLPEICGLR